MGFFVNKKIIITVNVYLIKINFHGGAGQD